MMDVRVNWHDNEEGIRPLVRGLHKLLLMGKSLIFSSVSPIVGVGSTLGMMAGWMWME